MICVTCLLFIHDLCLGGLSPLWVLDDRGVLCMQQHNTDQPISEYVRFPIGYVCILPHVKLMWCTRAL